MSVKSAEEFTYNGGTYFYIKKIRQERAKTVTTNTEYDIRLIDWSDTLKFMALLWDVHQHGDLEIADAIRYSSYGVRLLWWMRAAGWVIDFCEHCDVHVYRPCRCWVDELLDSHTSVDMVAPFLTLVSGNRWYTRSFTNLSKITNCIGSPYTEQDKSLLQLLCDNAYLPDEIDALLQHSDRLASIGITFEPKERSEPL